MQRQSRVLGVGGWRTSPSEPPAEETVDLTPPGLPRWFTAFALLRMRSSVSSAEAVEPPGQARMAGIVGDALFDD